MSLVNEALKKARLEAARQDAARRGLPPPGSQPVPASPLAPSIAIKGAAVALLVAVALLIFWAGRRSSSGEQTENISVAQARGENPSAEVPATVGASPETAPDSPAEGATDGVRAGLDNRSQAPGESQPAAPNTSRDAPATQDRLAAPRTEAPAPTAAPTTAAQSTPQQLQPPAAEQPQQRPRTDPGRPAAAQPSADTTSAQPQSFLRKLELPGSRPIELGGIAWSEDRPFALINGRVVGPGDQIEELMVVSVHPKHVELRGDQGYFLLRLK